VREYVAARAAREQAVRGRYGHNAAHYRDFLDSLERREVLKGFKDGFGDEFTFTLDLAAQIDLPEGERQDAPLGVDFDTLDDVRRQAERIWARAGDHNQTMPPLGGPHELERSYLGEWLACGALANDDME
jgi:hypothetical protein